MKKNNEQTNLKYIAFSAAHACALNTFFSISISRIISIINLP